MPITDYKVTDVERDAVYVQAQSDILSGTAAQNKAVFDAYPELIRDNLDGLCDFIATAPLAHTISTAAATTAKAPITGFVPLNAVIDLYFENGNTAVSPTIAIDGVTHTIASLPYTTTNPFRVKVKKTGASTLTWYDGIDYVMERGTSNTANGDWVWEKWASGKAWAYTSHDIGNVTLSGANITIETTMNLYYDNVVIGHNYPFTFTAVKYSATTHKSNGTGAVWIAGSNANTGSTTTPPGIILGRYATSAPTVNSIVLSNTTVGTWK